MPPFEALLRSAIGLDVASIGQPAIARSVLVRQRACGLTPAAYLTHVRESNDELQALIDEVVIPETWFFRDPQAFELLARVVRNEWLPAHPSATLRLLSLPCSTGEEPYSIAMALLDAGVPAGRFSVDAVDVSSRSLERAGRAVYGRNSFRGTDLGFRQRYFSEQTTGHHLSAEVRQQVQFRLGNIGVASSIAGVAIYDAIFCRNLLIYFDRPTQDRALDSLERLLTTDGLLFVAPSETSLMLGRGAGWAKEPKAFGFRRGTVPAVTRPARASSLSHPRAAPHPRTLAPSRPRTQPRPRPHPLALVTASTVEAASSLEGATRLADEGRFAEAAASCEAHIATHGPSAGVYCLLGVLRDAAGETDDAVAFYRKSLYLNPGGQDVLIHLALLLERLDRTAEAAVLRQRERRVARRTAMERVTGVEA